ncbi:protein AATF [Cephus cinctus]|uniref:Protein AATF n=1 Tax=Cephus cinctus TaxID=211228 RepID=A0AAJ7FCN3_CEPCN|nr:protein AATF [Cephus cinctus]
MSSKKKTTSLADKISSLVTAAPTNFGSDDEAEDTTAKVVEQFEDSDNSDGDFRDSSIRKRNVDLLDQIDERYKGKKVSRKDIYEEEVKVESSDELEEGLSENNFSEADSIQDSDTAEQKRNIEDDEDDDDSERDVSDSDNNQDSDGDSNESNSDNEVDSEIDEDNPLRRKTKSDLNFQHISATNVRSEVEKGNSVRNQLKVWENLLEMRIKLQKCLITSNKMPQYDTYKDFKKDNAFTATTNDAKNKLTHLLDSMLKLQSTLLKNYPETKNLNTLGKKRKADINESAEEDKDGYDDPMDEEIPSDTEDENEKNEDASDSKDESKEKENIQETPKKKLKLIDYERILAENHKSYAAYRNSVIQKWNDKTRIATGNLTKGTSQPVVNQIEYILNDKMKLLKRTQLKRSEYEIVGKTLEEDQDGRRVQEHDTEIYDDDDFYHQLLRELIEYKSSDVTDPIQLSKQWIQLQNMRSKMKRKIDTRATKGRRIRYNVHTKLVNFMAPITVNDTWTELARNELYSSLFGKIKPMPNEVGN